MWVLRSWRKSPGLIRTQIYGKDGYDHEICNHRAGVWKLWTKRLCQYIGRHLSGLNEIAIEKTPVSCYSFYKLKKQGAVYDENTGRRPFERREETERIIMDTVQAGMKELAEKREETSLVSRCDLEMSCKFYSYAIVGVMLDISHKKEIDVELVTDQIYRLITGRILDWENM